MARPCKFLLFPAARPGVSGAVIVDACRSLLIPAPDHQATGMPARAVPDCAPVYSCFFAREGRAPAGQPAPSLPLPRKRGREQAVPVAPVCPDCELPTGQPNAPPSPACGPLAGEGWGGGDFTRPRLPKFCAVAPRLLRPRNGRREILKQANHILRPVDWHAACDTFPAVPRAAAGAHRPRRGRPPAAGLDPTHRGVTDGL